MAKLPKYLKLEPALNHISDDCNTLNYKLIIKKWGIPILVHKYLKKEYELKWYQWLWYYPYFCFVALRGAASG